MKHIPDLVYDPTNDPRAVQTIPRDTLLKYYASLSGKNYDDVVDEYLGKQENIHTPVSNRTYMITEHTVASLMNYMERRR